jgi:hypothetical protein
MNLDYSFLREREDKLLRDIIKSSPGFFDINGELPPLWSKEGKPLTREAILKIIETENPRS